MTPAEVREQLIDTLRLDLVGPEPDSPHANERLPLQPSRWYLTGFMVPYEGGEEQRSDFAAHEELDHGGDDDAAGDEAIENRGEGIFVAIQQSATAAWASAA